MKAIRFLLNSPFDQDIFFSAGINRLWKPLLKGAALFLEWVKIILHQKGFYLTRPGASFRTPCPNGVAGKDNRYYLRQANAGRQARFAFFRYSTGLTPPVCFLNCRLKWLSSLKPSSSAICATVSGLLARRCCTSCILYCVI